MLLDRDRLTADRITTHEVDPGVDQPHPEFGGEIEDRGLPRGDPLPSHLHDLPVVESSRPHPPSHPVSRLDDDDLAAGRDQTSGGCQPGETGANDHDPGRDRHGTDSRPAIEGLAPTTGVTVSLRPCQTPPPNTRSASTAGCSSRWATAPGSRSLSTRRMPTATGPFRRSWSRFPTG